MWYVIELNLAIFIACGPAFLAFFRHYLPSIFGGSSHYPENHPSYPKHSYPLGTVPHNVPQTDKRAKTTVTTRSPYLEDNSSEEMIIGQTGIQKEAGLWMENEDLKAGKGGERSDVAQVW